MLSERLVLMLLLVIALYQIQAQTHELTSFQNNDLKTFSTVGNPKAKGLSMTFKYPSYFSIIDGNHPTVVGKVRYIGENYSVWIVVSVDKAVGANSFPDDEKRRAINPEMVVASLPQKSSFIQGGYTTFDNEIGSWCLYKTHQSVSGMEAWITMYMQQVVYSDYIVTLVYGVNDNSATIDKAKLCIDYIPFFQIVGSTIVFQDKWNDENVVNSKENKGTTYLIQILSYLALAFAGVIIFLIIKNSKFNR